MPVTFLARRLFADWRHSPPLVLAGVYRRENGENLRRIIEDEGLRRGDVALWALDEEHPVLSPHTVGVGPGGRFALLQSCIEKLSPKDGNWLVIADDDVALPSKGIRRAAVVAKAMALDIAQPAHAWNSYYTYPFTLARPLTVGRQTDFVEIGPLLLVSPRGLGLLPTLSHSSPMGWGVDVEWSEASRIGRVSLGIVDLVAMRHLKRPGRNYPTGGENRALTLALEAVGVHSILELQRTRRRWWMWDGAGCPSSASG
jgi:hypothetical protein